KGHSGSNDLAPQTAMPLMFTHISRQKDFASGLSAGGHSRPVPTVHSPGASGPKSKHLTMPVDEDAVPPPAPPPPPPAPSSPLPPLSTLASQPSASALARSAMLRRKGRVARGLSERFMMSSGFTWPMATRVPRDEPRRTVGIFTVN